MHAGPQVEAEFPDKSAPLCVGCQSGKRSEMASKMLAEAGYTQVTNVEGGFMGESMCVHVPLPCCACRAVHAGMLAHAVGNSSAGGRDPQGVLS